MLKAKNIIYGFCKYTNPPKNKYLISLYRSEELHIIAVFPTSQRRAGVAEPKHGCNIREGQIVSYVFNAGQPIGKKQGSDEDFSFPLQTTIPFDYCFREGEQDELLKTFDNPQVVGVLSDKEYIDLIYAFYTSPLTPLKYKPIFDKILQEYFLRNRKTLACNFWLCTMTIDPSVKVKGQENAYKEVIKTAVGGAAGLIHQVDSPVTDCQPNDNVEAIRSLDH